jgi:hypothetical protein
MGSLSSVRDMLMYDTADDVVRRFLVNSSGWRGADARRVKAELKSITEDR